MAKAGSVCTLLSPAINGWVAHQGSGTMQLKEPMASITTQKKFFFPLPRSPGMKRFSQTFSRMTLKCMRPTLTRQFWGVHCGRTATFFSSYFKNCRITSSKAAVTKKRIDFKFSKSGYISPPELVHEIFENGLFRKNHIAGMVKLCRYYQRSETMPTCLTLQLKFCCPSRLLSSFLRVSPSNTQ